MNRSSFETNESIHKENNSLKINRQMAFVMAQLKPLHFHFYTDSYYKPKTRYVRLANCEYSVCLIYLLLTHQYDVQNFKLMNDIDSDLTD